MNVEQDRLLYFHGSIGAGGVISGCSNGVPTKEEGRTVVYIPDYYELLRNAQVYYESLDVGRSTSITQYQSEY